MIGTGLRMFAATLAILRALDATAFQSFVAVNDPMGESATMAFLLKHDSVGGVLANRVEALEHGLAIDGREISKLEVMDPNEIPWADHDVDVQGTRVLGEGSDRRVEAGRVGEQRRDVLEADAGGRKVVDLPDKRTKVDRAHADAISRTSRQSSSPPSSCARSVRA